MAQSKSGTTGRARGADSTVREVVSIGAKERDAMIREAAYRRFEQRGRVHGDDVDDWLAAEAEIDALLVEHAVPDARRAAEVGGAPDLESEFQQSGARSIARDERLKRILRQHPQRDLAQIESLEPPPVRGSR